MNHIQYKAIKYTKPSKGSFDVASLFVSTKLQSDELIILVKYAALNPIDIISYKFSETTNITNRTRGIGREFSGIVLLASLEIDLKEGDHIIGLSKASIFDGTQGTVSEILLVKRKDWHLVKILQKIDLKIAACLPLSYTTALALVNYQKVDSNTKVLVIGGGTTIGSYVNQLLKNIYKVKDLYSIQSSKTDVIYSDVFKLAINSINYDKETRPLVVVADELISTTFEGEKFDLIIDTVGSNDFLKGKASKCLKKNGAYLTIVGDGVLNYNDSFFEAATKMIYPALRLVKNTVCNQSYQYRRIIPKPSEKDIDIGVNRVIDNSIIPLIDSVYSLNDFKKGFDRLATHQSKGKVLIEMKISSVI